MHDHSALVLRGFGAEPGRFRAQQLTEHIVGQADLTLTMTRSHRREVLRLDPRALNRTFTLREAADLLAELPEDPPPTAGDFRERAGRLVKALADLRPRRPTSAESDDVLDPIGRPLEVHQEAGELIAATLLPVLARITALHPARPQAVGVSHGE
jgi:protein-tyrosine phosphatase